MSNARTMLEFIRERNPDQLPLNPQWVEWALQMIDHADSRGVLVNPEYLRAEFVDIHDSEPPMFA